MRSTSTLQSPTTNESSTRAAGSATDHVAVIHANYLNLILSGEKTVEARLSLTRQPPYGRVARGDTIWFKASGGSFGAAARVRRVASWQHLVPSGIEQLRADHNSEIRGEAEFWKCKRRARYATLVWLSDVRAIEQGPAYTHTPGGRAWYVLTPTLA